MTKSMISVRIPESLIDELKIAAKEDHYMDVSEAVRSIVRQNWMRNKDPLAYQVDKLRKEISDNISQKQQEALLSELKKIRDSLKND